MFSQTSEKKESDATNSLLLWDVSGFVRLFYILSKNKIFCNFSDKYSLFLANNIVISINYYNFFFKILFFVKIKNKRTKPDTSLCDDDA